MSLNPSHHYQMSFPGLSEYGIPNVISRFIGIRNIKCHSPVYWNTEYQVSFPGWPEYGISSFIPRLAGLRKFTQIQFSQVSFPVCRMTKCQKCHPQCVWSKDVTNQNVCFYKPSVYKYISKFSNVYSRSCFPFIYLHITINTAVDNHFPPVELQHTLAESDPFLQRIWVSLCSSSFKTNHLRHPTFIITSQTFITS